MRPASRRVRAVFSESMNALFWRSWATASSAEVLSPAVSDRKRSVSRMYSLTTAVLRLHQNENGLADEPQPRFTMP